jgi:pilus assembly protein CpaB
MFNKINRSWVILLGAVVFGGLAVFASSRYIQQTLSVERAKLNPQVEMLDVVVSKADLERGSNIGSENMAVRQVPKEFVPGTAVTPEQFANVEGARLAVDMRSGEILLRGTLEGADTATFATKVREGVRAMTVAVDEVNSISGMLQPGDRIDLFFTARPPVRPGLNQQPPEQTLVLMQNVLLLATGRQVRPSIGENGQPGATRAYSTITLEATPHDAQRLILAQKSGTLTAVLRGPEDKEPLVATSMDSRDLFGMRPPVRVAKAGTPDPRVEMIIGGRGSKAEREMVAIAPFLQPAAAPPSLPPTAKVEADAANAVSQLLRAASPAQMDLR